MYVCMYVCSMNSVCKTKTRWCWRGAPIPILRSVLPTESLEHTSEGVCSSDETRSLIQSVKSVVEQKKNLSNNKGQSDDRNYRRPVCPFGVEGGGEEMGRNTSFTSNLTH